MKNKNKILLILTIIILFLVILVGILSSLKDENKFTSLENKYITSNTSNLISVNVVNDSPVFGNSGAGVFYDFLKDFENKYSLTFNIIVENGNSQNDGLQLSHSTKLPKNSKLIYEDHFVLIKKEYESISTPKNISGSVGILTNNVKIANDYLGDYKLTFTNYENKSELVKALSEGEVAYILVPLDEYLDVITENLYNIVYHVSDMKNYYYMKFSNDELLSSILSKYFNTWNISEFDKSYNKSEFNLFTKNLKITEKELDLINSKVYKYGYVESAPYDIQVGGIYGGLTRIYVQGFEEFSGITIEKKSFRNYIRLKNAVSNNKIDLYLNYYNEANNNYIESLNNMSISILMNNSDRRVITNFASLKREVVYAKENSQVYKYLIDNKINTATYKNDREAKKLLKNEKIVAMDVNNSKIFLNNSENFRERFNFDTEYMYSFISSNDTMFNRLFKYYSMTIDKNQMLNDGYDNYNKTKMSGSLIYRVAKYAIGIILIVVIVLVSIYNFSKKIRIKVRIKKNDKMKYIDMLTSLKNRNFLSEHMTVWNQNTIYPQSVIVIDLNSMKELNDSYGYQEGDKQIQAAANILIKTQLDNSEIMRTDGNEFTIYLIGYNEKQILSYMKKLNKEFKSLPYDKGVAMGFSMITDDIKLLDDAINEAMERMKENKELFVKEN